MKRLSKVVLNMKRVGDVALERKQNLKKSPTKAEILFRELTKHYQLGCSFQKLVFTKNRYYILDFVTYMHPRTIFEIDGSSHNGKQDYDRQRERDVLATRVYRNHSFMRITNEQVFNGEAEKLILSRFPRRQKFPPFSK
jgi:very-short-patch-repair endonuclease